MRAQKITKHNFNSYNDQGIDSVPVKARFFNDLYEDVVELITSLQTEDVALEGDVDSILGYISAIQTLDGTAGQLTPVSRTNNPCLTGASFYSNINKLDDAIGADATPVARTVGPIAVANSVNTNIDALDTVIGFDAQLSGTPNVISRSLSIYQNLDALDTKAQWKKAVTATVGGTSAGQLEAVNQFVTITSSNVDYIISLPLLTVFETGGTVKGYITNTGCELRVHPTDQAVGITMNGVTGGNELKLNQGTAAYFEAVKLNITKWIVKTYSSLGAPTTVVPDK